MDRGDPQAVRARIKALQEEIALIRAADWRYRLEVFHTPFDRPIHKDQVLRLKQIMEELASLSRAKIARKGPGPEV